MKIETVSKSYDIDLFSDELDGVVDEVEEIVLQAIWSTITRTKNRAKTLLSSSFRNDAGWNVRKKELDERMRVGAYQGGKTYESFDLIIKGRAINLAFFGLRTTGGNVSVKPKRSGGRVKVKGGFVRWSSKGARIILRRTTSNRYPLSTSNMISPVTMFGDGEFADKFEDVILSFIEERFEHEKKWRMQKAGYL